MRKVIFLSVLLIFSVTAEHLVAQDCRDYSSTMPFLGVHFKLNNDLLLFDDFLLVIEEEGERWQVGVYDPTSPADLPLVARCRLPVYAGDWLKVHENLVFGCASWAVAVMDFTDPHEPRFLKKWELGGDFRDLHIQDNLMYVANNWQSLQVWEISDLAAPVLLNEILVPGAYVGKVEFQEGFLVVGTRNTLLTYSLEDPVNPVQVASVSSSPHSWGLLELQCFDHWVIARHADGLVIHDYSNPLEPALVETYTGPIDRFFSLDIQGEMALVSEPDVGVHVLDVSDFPTIQHQKTLGSSGSPYDALVLDGNALIRDYVILIQIVDIESYAPVDPLVTSTNLEETIWSLTIQGDYMYGLDTFSHPSQRGIRVMHLESEGATPQVGSLDIIGTGIDLFGDRISVPGYSAGIRFVDISDPENPTHLFDFSLPGICYGLTRDGTVLYTNQNISDPYSWENRVCMVDLNDPDSPQLLATSPDLGDDIKHLHGNQGSVLLVMGSGDVVSARMSPEDSQWGSSPAFEVLDRFQKPGYNYYRSSILADGMLYLAGGGTVTILDVSDPGDLRLVSSYRLPISGSPGYFTLHGTILYCATFKGIIALDVSDPASLRPLGFLDLGLHHTALVCTDEFLYACNQDFGMNTCYPACGDNPESPWIRPENFSEILNSEDETLKLGPIFPQPANPSVTIEYSAPAGSRARIGIYDLRGRLVRNWHLNVVGPSGRVTWNGLDRSGNTVASGTYFVQLRVGNAVQKKRVILVR